MLDIGRIFMSAGITNLVEGDLSRLFPFILRHQQGDWGEVTYENKIANDQEIQKKQGGRLFSVYTLNETKIWISTVGFGTRDCYTTILLPEEY